MRRYNIKKKNKKKNAPLLLCTEIYEALCFDVAQGRLNGAPNETRTHSCRFASQACEPLHNPRFPILLCTPWVDYSQILYPYWKSPLCNENRDDATTITLEVDILLTYIWWISQQNMAVKVIRNKLANGRIWDTIWKS